MGFNQRRLQFLLQRGSITPDEKGRVLQSLVDGGFVFRGESCKILQF
jgi:hypothetical protein